MFHLLTTVILGVLCKKNRVQTEFVVDKFTLGSGLQFFISQSIVYFDTEIVVN